MPEPTRLQKYLAERGVASCRGYTGKDHVFDIKLKRKV